MNVFLFDGWRAAHSHFMGREQFDLPALDESTKLVSFSSCKR